MIRLLISIPAVAVLLVSSDVLAPVLLVESLVAPIVDVLLVSVELGDVVLTLELELLVSVWLGGVVDAVLELLGDELLLVSGEAARDWSVVGSVALLVLEEGAVVVDELP